METKSKNKKKKFYFKRFTRKFITNTISAISAILATIAILMGFVFAISVSHAEVPQEVKHIPDKRGITFMANDGSTVIGVLQPSNGLRNTVTSEQISPIMKKALVAAEDASFYTNPGFSGRRTVIAALQHASGNSSAGGASTVTQQLVKNTIVGDEVSLDRKWKEMITATKMTMNWEKDEIITSYLNTIYFGRNALGIERAAQAYFGIPASQLNSSQAALLAGVIQSPSIHDPAVNEESSRQRFEYVVGEMKKLGFIEQNEKVEFPETIEYTPPQSIGLEGANGHIITTAIAELDKIGYDLEKLYDIGATIVTTIDMRAQDIVVGRSAAGARDNGVQVGVTAVDPHTGGIRAMYGGDDGQGFNYATSPQMSGSSFKVVTLAAALENGIGLETNIDSSPYVAEGGSVLNNSGGMTCGNCSLAEATKQSLNTSFYRLQDMLPEGPVSTQKMAFALGADQSRLADENGFVAKAITLGSYGISTAEMAGMMGTIANNGTKIKRHIVQSIKTDNGNTAYEFKDKGTRVISDYTAGEIDRALAPIPAYSNGNQLSGKQGYGKTGTVQRGDVGGANRDAYMAGYTDNMGIAVWVGTNDGSPLVDASGAAIWGAGLPATIWKDILNQIG